MLSLAYLKSEWNALLQRCPWQHTATIAYKEELAAYLLSLNFLI